MSVLVGVCIRIRSNLEKINVRAILSPGTKHWSVIAELHPRAKRACGQSSIAKEMW